MRLLIAGIGLLFGASLLLNFHPELSIYSHLAQTFFLPWLASFFLGLALLNPVLFRSLELSPIQVFILSMVVKMILGLTILIIYLLKDLGPQIEGAIAFMTVYIILEFLEIIRFLSILRAVSPRQGKK